jgi:hypothetical protein
LRRRRSSNFGSFVGRRRVDALVLRAPTRRFNIVLNALPLQTRDDAKTVCKKLRESHSQGERGTSIVFCATVRAADALLEKFRKGTRLGDDASAVMHSKLTFAEKCAVLERLMSGRLRALIGTSILQMGIDASAVLCVLFSQVPLSLEELYQAAGRAGRGTTLTATMELVFDIGCVTGCLALIAGDSVGIANFTAVIELLVDHYHCKHSFLSEALGDFDCIIPRSPARAAAAPARRLTSRARTSSASTSRPSSSRCAPSSRATPSSTARPRL